MANRNGKKKLVDIEITKIAQNLQNSNLHWIAKRKNESIEITELESVVEWLANEW